MSNRRRLDIRIAFVVSTCCLVVAAASAQERVVPPGPLSLEQVLQLAEATSEGIAAARAGIRRAEGDQVRARSELFPQVSVSFGYDRTLASEFEDVFDTAGGGVSCPPFALNRQAMLEDRVAEIERAIDCGAVGGSAFGGGSDGSGFEDLPFGRENIWRATLSFSQSIYSGGRIGAQRDIASAGRDTASLALSTTRAQLLFDVTQAYYDAALSERLVDIAEATLEQANATLFQTQAGFDAGTQPEFEVLRARVSRDNQTPILIRQRVNRDVARLRLKQMLELPPTYDLRLADSLSDEVLAPPPVFATTVAAAESALKAANPELFTLQTDIPLPDRVVVAEANAAVRLNEASLRLARSQSMPNVTVTSTYGRVAYPSSVFTGFDDLRTNWTVGASVQVPLLTGGRLRGDRLVAQADLERARAELRQTEELAALDTRSTWAELLAARAAWEASAGTIQQADRAYQIADVRYRAGVSTQLELSDSRLQLQQAEANRAQAARDLQVARARVALLPELPLGTGTAPGGQVPRAPVVPQQPPPQPPNGGQLVNAGSSGTSLSTGMRE